MFPILRWLDPSPVGVAEPDVHHAVLPHADGGHGGHAPRCSRTRPASCRRPPTRRSARAGLVMGRLRTARSAPPRVGGSHHGHVPVTPPDVMAWPPCKSSVSSRLRCCGDGSEPPTTAVRVRVHDIVQVHADAPTIWFWPATCEPYFISGVSGRGPVVGGSTPIDGSAWPLTVNTISLPWPVT